MDKMKIMKQRNEVSVQNNNYIMEVPKIAKQVFGLMVIFGGILFCIFLLFYLMKRGNVTIEHLYIAIACMIIGIAAVVCANRWKIVVDVDEIKFYNIFSKNKTIQFADIQKVYIGYKNELELYVDGKKIKTIDYQVTNYNCFCKSLENHKVEIRVKE